MGFYMEKPERFDRIIAGLLWYGTLLALTFIAVGMAMGILFHIGHSSGVAQAGYKLVKFGVAIFIALPIARVVLTIVLFLKVRDYRYTAISSVVLVIIGVGMLIGLWSV